MSIKRVAKVGYEEEVLGIFFPYSIVLYWALHCLSRMSEDWVITAWEWRCFLVPTFLDADLFCSVEDQLPEEEVPEDNNKTFTYTEQEHPQQQRRGRMMKKPVTLNLNGIPWGSMKECLANDIKKYAKSLDPTCNWESHPSPQQEQLFKRLYKGTVLLSSGSVFFSDNILPYSHHCFCISSGVAASLGWKWLL